MYLTVSYARSASRPGRVSTRDNCLTGHLRHLSNSLYRPGSIFVLDNICMQTTKQACTIGCVLDSKCRGLAFDGRSRPPRAQREL
jgi:hypothetical protein